MRSSGEHRRNGHGSVFSANHDDARIGYVPSARAIGVEVVTDASALRKTYVLIQDGAPHFGMAANVAVIHDDGAFHQRTGVHADTASKNRVAHDAAGKNASARDDAVESLP